MPVMRILVTGGTGYIGSHTTVALLEANHDVVIVDDLSNSKHSALQRIQEISGRSPEFVQLDVLNRDALAEVFDANTFDGVIHFAGLKSVAESVAQPLRYYQVNVGGTMSVASLAVRYGVPRMVFSSSSTVYDPEGKLPYQEDGMLAPLNPYGWSKLMSERVWEDIVSATQLKAVSLRYFNPVGAHESGLLGENPLGVPNNLMPLISRVASGDQKALRIFGRDYATPDGTCLRDYIHVQDLADAHVAALGHVAGMDTHRAFNIGTGQSCSVLELITSFERATGAVIPTEDAPRRPGDAVASWADVSAATRELGWIAKRSTEQACADNWRWMKMNPTGLPD